MEYNIRSPYYIRKANGGLSPCIEGNNAYGLRPFPGSVLPNCVGAAVAEFNRMIFGDENPQIKYLGNRNAVDFTKFPAEQGLETGQMPRVGACMVWGHGEGHVGVVKQVIGRSQFSARSDAREARTENGATLGRSCFSYIRRADQNRRNPSSRFITP